MTRSGSGTHTTEGSAAVHAGAPTLSASAGERSSSGPGIWWTLALLSAASAFVAGASIAVVGVAVARAFMPAIRLPAGHRALAH